MNLCALPEAGVGDAGALGHGQVAEGGSQPGQLAQPCTHHQSIIQHQDQRVFRDLGKKGNIFSSQNPY